MTSMSFRYLALAADYDDTLASEGTIAPPVIDALTRVKASGRRLLLVTGRQLDDLVRICPDLALFDRVVAENGALVYRPDTGEERLLAGAPNAALVERLRGRGVNPLATGRAIVAAEASQRTDVMHAIRELGLELRVILNKLSLMVLPPGVDKAHGLLAALEDLRIPPSNVVGIGDAENDDVFLKACGCGIALANAVPALKEAADLVAGSGNGQGVVEVVGRLLSGELETIRATR
jgi:HAD superfamily hydrolase (TIGR01484 family)